MRGLRIAAMLVGLLCVNAQAVGRALQGFVDVNGVRLEYLDWGGRGPVLILIHGLADGPHVFDDLAPGFTDRYHVVAYATRQSGVSDAVGPYDVDTMTEDLSEVMDALRVSKATLVGYSASGNEVTAMAVAHPERVERLVYLDAGYDWSDPDFEVLVKALPKRGSAVPASALTSLAAFWAYQKAVVYPGLGDLSRIEANLLERIAIQRDGSVKLRFSEERGHAIYSALWSNKPREYGQVRCPVLAVYATSVFDLHSANGDWRRELQAYEDAYWKPFQLKSIERVRREIAGVQVAQVPGAHVSFTLTERPRIVRLIRKFLAGQDRARQH